MTKGELDLMRTMLREELEPVKAELAAQGERIVKLEKKDEAFEAKSKQLSGQYRAVTTVTLPQMQSEAEKIRKGDMGAVADAFGKMAHVLNDVGDAVSAMRTDMQPRTVVELPDGKGGTSVRPASLVAAESSIRTENKQDGLAQVVLDAALETTTAKDNSEDVKKWQKRVTTPLVVAVPILVAIVREVWPLIFH